MNIEKLPKEIQAEIPEIVEKFKINTPLRLAHFLGQCHHESAGFKVYRENLNYSDTALQGIFKKYFPTPELAKEYARKPEKIANRVYASRMGNGDEASGDGWKFRGRGAIQCTGRSNYTAFGKSIGVDIANDPDLVATKYPLLSAAWFWHSNNLNALADKGDGDQQITIISKRVNGGTHGLADRIVQVRKYQALLK